MNFLFWLLCTLDLLILLLSVSGGIFRGQLSAQNAFTSVHFWGIVFSLLALIGGLILRYTLKMQNGSLLLVALPLLALLAFYLLDKD